MVIGKRTVTQVKRDDPLTGHKDQKDKEDQRGTRREYASGSLTRADLANDPLSQFRVWLDAAIASGATDATAMALATSAISETTSGIQAIPSVRIVLLKHFDDDGFCWYTDYRSQKGAEIASNPFASALFYWHEFERQVRITGPVEELTQTESQRYFLERPTESRYAAAASEQSAIIDSRATLEQRVAKLQQNYPDGRVPRPDQWGGYRMQPVEYEFWQGREGRLHDRFRYTRRGAGWTVDRLQP